MIDAVFLDGPAEGVPLRIPRAPAFLRVGVHPDAGVSALAAINATPRPDEELSVYRRLGYTPDGLVGYAVDEDFDPDANLQSVLGWQQAVRTHIMREERAAA